MEDKGVVGDVKHAVYFCPTTKPAHLRSNVVADDASRYLRIGYDQAMRDVIAVFDAAGVLFGNDGVVTFTGGAGAEATGVASMRIAIERLRANNNGVAP